MPNQRCFQKENIHYIILLTDNESATVNHMQKFKHKVHLHDELQQQREQIKLTMALSEQSYSICQPEVLKERHVSIVQ